MLGLGRVSDVASSPSTTNKKLGSWNYLFSVTFTFHIWCAEIKILMCMSLHDTTLLLYNIIFGLMLRFNRSVSVTKPKYYCFKIIYLLYSSMSSYFGPSWKACKGSKWSLSARHLQRLLQLRIFHLMLNLLFYSFYEFTFGDLEIVPKINVLTRLVLHC